MAINTYFIGGIATDIRLYHHVLQTIPGAVYLPFPQPENGDTLTTYSRKFIPAIDTTQPFYLVAHSMGGMMAMELSRYIHPEKIVLISSVKCRAEMPWRLRQLKYSKLHRLFPGQAFRASVQYGSHFTREINSIPGLRETIVQMAQNNSPGFLYWCVHAIANWNGTNDHSTDIIHIHGTRDTMFPLKNIRNVIPVAGGTHHMLLTRKEEITALLLRYLT